MRSTMTDVAWKRPMSNKKYSPCQTSVVWRLWIVDLRKKYSTSSILTTQNHRNKNARYFITQTKVSMWARRLSHSRRTNVLKIDFALKIGNWKSDNFWFTSSKKTIHEHQNQQVYISLWYEPDSFRRYIFILANIRWRHYTRVLKFPELQRGNKYKTQFTSDKHVILLGPSTQRTWKLDKEIRLE